jgi:hypothetical protein
MRELEEHWVEWLLVVYIGLMWLVTAIEHS